MCHITFRLNVVYELTSSSGAGPDSEEQGETALIDIFLSVFVATKLNIFNLISGHFPNKSLGNFPSICSNKIRYLKHDNFLTLNRWFVCLT